MVREREGCSWRQYVTVGPCVGVGVGACRPEWGGLSVKTFSAQKISLVGIGGGGGGLLYLHHSAEKKTNAIFNP